MNLVGKQPLLSFVLTIALLCSLLPVALWQPVPTAIAQTKTETLVEIPGTLPGNLALAKPAVAPAKVAEESNEIVIALKPRNEALFESTVRQISNPQSPLYRQFLSDSDFQKTFAPTDQTVQAFKDYFTQQGLTIGYQNRDGLLLSVKGSRTQLDKAFGTTSEFKAMESGETGFVNTSPVRLPASLAANVKGLAGFNTLHRFRINSDYRDLNRFITPQAAITATNTPTTTRQTYNVDNTGLDGEGTTVAITLWGAPDLNDIGRWLNYWGRPLSLTLIPPTPASTDDSLRFEANMDVQIVHTYAPKAAQRFYVADGPWENLLLIALTRAIDDNVNAISNSWAGCERDISPAMVSAYHLLFARASAKGIPLFFGSGDSGIYTCNILTSGSFNFNLKAGYASFPGDEYTTSVGGTRVGRDDSTGAWYNEVAWSCQPNAFLGDFYCLQGAGGAGGGGMTIQSPRPDFQSAIVPPVEPKFVNNPPNPTRLEPDLSMNADPATGQPVFAIIAGIPIFGASCNDSCNSGGTSASTPAMSAVAALAAQKAGGHVGTFNYFIYQNANSNAAWFHDITEGYTGSNARPGWDYTSGLGSLKDVNAFINAFTAPSQLRPFVYANKVQMTELTGNNNGVIDLNESIKLQIELQNNGIVTATQISTQLSSLTPGVTILNGFSDYPSIAHGLTATNASNFSFKFSGAANCGQTLHFKLAVSFNGTFSYTYDFSLPTGTPTYGPPTTYVYAGGLTAIPDNTPGGVTLTLPISATGRIGDVNVKLSATHIKDSDLRISVLSPAGTRRILTHKAGGDTGQNYANTLFDDEATIYTNEGTAPFAGSYRPEEPLSLLDTEFITGTWQLNAIDLAAGNVGTLDSWQLEITPATYNCGPAEPPKVIPSLTAVAPNPIMAGTPDFVLTVTGTNFVTGAILRWNGNDRPTNVVSSNLVTANILASDIANSGTFSVTVFNIGDLGGESTALTVTVQPCIEFVISRNLADGYCGSLNRAVQQANAATQPVTLTFAPGITRVTLSAALPQIGAAPGVALTLDGGCNAGVPGVQLIAATGAGNPGLNIGSNVTVRGLAISGASGYAVRLAGSNNTLVCNRLGTLDGVTAAPNGGGILVEGKNNQLGIANQPNSGNTIFGKSAIRVAPGGQLKINYPNIIRP